MLTGLSAWSGRTGERLRDAEPRVRDITRSIDGHVGAVPTLGDQQAEVEQKSIM